MARDYFKYVEGVQIKMDFTKKTAGLGSGNFLDLDSGHLNKVSYIKIS